MKRATLLLLSLLLPLSVTAQYNRQHVTASASVVMSADLASNASSATIVVVPARKQLGNYGTGCSSGTITPSPAGQLYATTAIQTAAEGATPACATEGVPTVTNSGTGIAAVDNGNGAGGTDSATALTDTYGGTADDAICSGDPHHADATLFPGLPAAGCDTSASAYFSETTATGHGNSDVLFPSNYATNSTTLDGANWYMRSFYVMWDSVSTLWDSEHDVNVNSSPTAYAQAGCSASGTVTQPCGYFGWGTHWGSGLSMWATCPQGCSGWHKMVWKDMAGGADVTTWVPTVNHWYHVIEYGHRNANCSYGSSSNCYFYDFFTVYDVTAATAPHTYYILDSTTGLKAGGVPVNHSTWTSGITPQVQLDMTTAAATTGMHIQSDVTQIFSLN